MTKQCLIFFFYLKNFFFFYTKSSEKKLNKEGKEVKCDVLFTFDSDETKKSYIVYTDNTKDDAGNIQVFASIYDPKMENPKLDPIETDQEWKIIETILNTLQEEIKKKAEILIPAGKYVTFKE